MNKIDTVDFLQTNGFSLERFADGWFWVYKYPAEWPQFPGESNIFQVDVALNNFTTLIEGCVEEHDSVSFRQAFNRI